MWPFVVCGRQRASDRNNTKGVDLWARHPYTRFCELCTVNDINLVKRFPIPSASPATQRMENHVVRPHPLDADAFGWPHFSVISTAPVRIESLTTDHIPAFRALRLDALRRHPEAFIPTWEEERRVDPSTIASRYRDDWIHDGNFILGAFLHGRLVGAIGVRRWGRQKQRHRATIWLLFTDPSARGRGIGRSLLNDAIDRCRSHPEIELLHLSVSVESETARRLYEDAGFACYGVEPKAIKLDDRVIDVALMALDLCPMGDA